MRALFLLAVVCLGGGHGGGVTDLGVDDVSKYLAKDLKAIGHLYDKISDKDLYGITLPPAITFDVATKPNEGALEKTEPFEANDYAQASVTYPYYNQISEGSVKQAHTNNYLSYSDLEALNQNKDLQVNTYLTNLQQWGKQNIELPAKGLDGFRPYFSSDSVEGNNYKGLQNNLSNKLYEGQGSAEDYRKFGTNTIRSKVRHLKGNLLNTHAKCRSGICTNKSKPSNRIYYRPVKKIKKIEVYSY